MTMAYGVIGNTTVSGTVILGSSPGRPAPRSSSGLGRRPLTPVTRVQIPYGVQISNTATSGRLHFQELTGGFRYRGGMLTANELIISQFQTIGRDEFTIKKRFVWFNAKYDVDMRRKKMRER